MIEAENLKNVTVVLTARKLELCKLIKNQLATQGIQKSDDEITNAVGKVKNAFFITEIEKTKQQISPENNILQKLIQQHPPLLDIVSRELLSK